MATETNTVNSKSRRTDDGRQETTLQQQLNRSIADGAVDSILLLLNDESLDLDNRDVGHDLQTPLMRMCHMRCSSERLEKVVERLERCAWNPNVQDVMGRTLVMHACIAHCLPVLFLCLDNECDVSLSDRDGNSVLVYAVRSGSDAIVRPFLDLEGCRSLLDKRNNLGQTPLDMALLYGLETIATMLSSTSPPHSPTSPSHHHHYHHHQNLTPGSTLATPTPLLSRSPGVFGGGGGGGKGGGRIHWSVSYDSSPLLTHESLSSNGHIINSNNDNSNDHDSMPGTERRQWSMEEGKKKMKKTKKKAYEKEKGKKKEEDKGEPSHRSGHPSFPLSSRPDLASSMSGPMSALTTLHLNRHQSVMSSHETTSCSDQAPLMHHQHQQQQGMDDPEELSLPATSRERTPCSEAANAATGERNPRKGGGLLRNSRRNKLRRRKTDDYPGEDSGTEDTPLDTPRAGQTRPKESLAGLSKGENYVSLPDLRDLKGKLVTSGEVTQVGPESKHHGNDFQHRKPRNTLQRNGAGGGGGREGNRDSCAEDTTTQASFVDRHKGGDLSASLSLPPLQQQSSSADSADRRKDKVLGPGAGAGGKTSRTEEVMLRSLIV